MDYEKKYKDALCWIKDVYPTFEGAVKEDAEHYFPELRESEGERIRMALIHYFSHPENTSFEYWEAIPKSEAIAWLEKQGQTFTKKDVDDAYLKGVCDAKHELEKQGEQKPTWSEEDKGNLLDVKCIIDKVWHSKDFREDTYYSAEELESLWSWLDDIWQRLEYPQDTWKPSDELDEASYQVGIKRVLENPESYGLKKYNWKPSDEQIQALEYQVHSTYEGSWQYKASKELLEQLKKL